MRSKDRPMKARRRMLLVVSEARVSNSNPWNLKMEPGMTDTHHARHTRNKQYMSNLKTASDPFCHESRCRPKLAVS